jgi:hypothetical protein
VRRRQGSRKGPDSAAEDGTAAHLLIPGTGTPQCDGASCPAHQRHGATTRWSKLKKRAAEAVDWESLERYTFPVAVVRERRKWGASQTEALSTLAIHAKIGALR